MKKKKRKVFKRAKSGKISLKRLVKTLFFIFLATYVIGNG